MVKTPMANKAKGFIFLVLAGFRERKRGGVNCNVVE